MRVLFPLLAVACVAATGGKDAATPPTSTGPSTGAWTDACRGCSSSSTTSPTTWGDSDVLYPVSLVFTAAGPVDGRFVGAIVSPDEGDRVLAELDLALAFDQRSDPIGPWDLDPAPTIAVVGGVDGTDLVASDAACPFEDGTTCEIALAAP